MGHSSENHYRKDEDETLLPSNSVQRDLPCESHSQLRGFIRPNHHIWMVKEFGSLECSVESQSKNILNNINKALHSFPILSSFGYFAKESIFYQIE